MNQYACLNYMLDEIDNLDELWDFVKKVNNKNFPENGLVPICGNGKLSSPKFMFVFINPTHVNTSSDENWKGSRFPFAGTRSFWRVVHRAGLFDDELMDVINNSKDWSLEFAEKVLQFLKNNSLYLTNIVKWTGQDATLPDSEKIKLFLPILEREIRIVRPEYIITFGLIPFENLTKQKIKLSEYHSKVMENKNLKFFDVDFGDFKTKLIPSYFPVGRGNPKKAAEILKMVKLLAD